MTAIVYVSIHQSFARTRGSVALCPPLYSIAPPLSSIPPSSVICPTGGLSFSRSALLLIISPSSCSLRYTHCAPAIIIHFYLIIYFSSCCALSKFSFKIKCVVIVHCHVSNMKIRTRIRGLLHALVWMGGCFSGK